jgi:hypothetical protein
VRGLWPCGHNTTDSDPSSDANQRLREPSHLAHMRAMLGNVVPAPPDEPEHLSLREAAAFLQVSAQTLRRWDREGKLPARRNPNNAYRYYARSDLERFSGAAPRESGPSDVPGAPSNIRTPAASPAPAAPEPVPHPPLDIRRAEELQEVAEESPWLVEGLWADQGVGLIGGEPKCCKSFLALDLAVSVASGLPCLRRYAVRRRGSVLLFAAEDPLNVVRRRLDGIARAAGTQLAGLDVRVVVEPSIRLDLERDQTRIRDAVAAIRPALVILDPLIRLHQVSENASGEIARVLAYLRAIQREFHTAVLVVHHMKKGGASLRGGQALRGSSDLHAWGDSNLYLKRKDGDLVLHIEHRGAKSDEEDLLLELHEQEGGGLALRTLEREEEDGEVEEREGRGPEPVGRLLDAPRVRIKQILSRAREPLGHRELRNLCGLRNQTLCAVLKGMTESGELMRTGGRYSLPPGDVAQAAG